MNCSGSTILPMSSVSPAPDAVGRQFSFPLLQQACDRTLKRANAEKHDISRRHYS